jgi:hypothetical protein
LAEGAPEDGVEIAEAVSSLSLEDLGELIGSTGGPSPMADEDDNNDDSDDDAGGDEDAGDDDEEDN